MKFVMGSLLVLLALTLTLVPVGLAAPAAGEGDTLGIHTVKPGETLFCIGRAYGVDPWAIVKQNGIVNPNLIQPGVQLHIPAAWRTLPPGPTCTRQPGVVLPPTPTPLPTPPPCGQCTCRAQHLIKTGDTLTALGIQYQVSPWEIARCNCLANPNYIRIGDKLCIP